MEGRRQKHLFNYYDHQRVMKSDSITKENWWNIAWWKIDIDIRMIMERSSVWPLPSIVSRRVVAADNESPTVVTLNLSAAELLGISPDHLSIVAAHLTSSAGIRIVIIILLLVNPRHHSGCHGIWISLWFEKIFTVSTTRVLHSTVCDAFICIVLCVSRHSGVPYERADTQLGSRGIVRG